VGGNVVDLLAAEPDLAAIPDALQVFGGRAHGQPPSGSYAACHLRLNRKGKKRQIRVSDLRSEDRTAGQEQRVDTGSMPL
jgi:hypothetical protein